MLTGQGEEVLPADEHSGRTVAERYIGAFDRGVRHGQGRLERGVASAWTGEWATCWTGEWSHGEPHGRCEEFVEQRQEGQVRRKGPTTFVAEPPAKPMS